jgi:tetratricopeptide (TPR) repeat protein
LRVIAVLFGLAIGFGALFLGVRWQVRRSADATLRDVRTLLSRGENEAARGRLQRLLWFNSESPEAHVLLGRAHYMAGEYQQAIDVLDRVPADAPSNRQAGMLRVDACLALADLHHAEQALVDHIRRYPNELRATDELRWLYFNQFRHREVELLLMEALHNTSDRYDVAFDLLMTEFRGPVAREGIEYLQQINTLRPDQPEVLSALGFCHWRLGDMDRGLEMLKASLRLEPGNELTRYRIAELCLEQGDVATARDCLAEFSKVSDGRSRSGFSDGDDRWNWLMSRCAERDNDIESALELIERALAQRPFELKYVQLRGRYLQLLGRSELAAQAFAESRDLGACEIRLTEIVWSGALQQPDAALAGEVAELCRRRGRELEAELWDTLARRLAAEQL